MPSDSATILDVSNGLATITLGSTIVSRRQDHRKAHSFRCPGGDPVHGQRLRARLFSIPVSTDPDRSHVKTALDVVYDWDYEGHAGLDQLRTLYAKALESQWIAMKRLDWTADVDRDALTATPMMGGLAIEETDWWTSLPAETRWEVSRRSATVTLSNFLHGEQGALFVASQLVSAVPHLEGKFYASTQALDEARHVEVFSAYIRKVGEIRPILPSLQGILDQILATDEWMKKAVGMNIVLEGLALFAFRDLRNRAQEPLLRELLTHVSQDEARHTGFGVLYLQKVVSELDDAGKADLEDFGFETARLLVDSRRSLTPRDAVFALMEEVGIDRGDLQAAISRERETLRRTATARGTRGGPLGSFVIPVLQRIGLFSDRVRGHFDQLFRELSTTGQGVNERIGDLPDDLEAWVAQGA